MTRLGGFPGFGGMPDMQKMIQQAKKLKEDADRMQQEMELARYEASSGGGLVTVTVDGHGIMVRVRIDPSAIDPTDAEMLEDLVVTAARDAAQAARDAQEEKVRELAGPLEGLNLPPGLF